MSKQIVISGNRILAYGEDCFLSMGGTVICPETEKVYQNATIANVDILPSDIDSVGYEYHAGEFVPCAPFGKGNGNVAVVCGEDCKAIKDSGISLTQVGLIATYTYTGNTSNNARVLPFNSIPYMVFIKGVKSSDYVTAIVYPHMSYALVIEGTTITHTKAVSIQDNTNVKITSDNIRILDKTGYTYEVIAICTTGGVTDA